jgi:hypothetical protein
MDSRQSTFVTVLAWMVIVVAGLSLLAGLLQSIVIGAFMPLPVLSESEARELPAMARLLFTNFNWIVFANTFFAAVALAAGLGLLKRHEWARLVMIGMLVLATAGFTVLVVAQQFFISAIFPEGDDTPSDVRSIMLAMRIGSAIFGLLFVGLHAWLAVRLNSPTIRAEFQPN